MLCAAAGEHARAEDARGRAKGGQKAEAGTGRVKTDDLPREAEIDEIEIDVYDFVVIKGLFARNGLFD